MPSSSKPQPIEQIDCSLIWDEINEIEFIQDVRELTQGSPHGAAIKIPLRSPAYTGNSINEMFAAWFERMDTSDTEYVKAAENTMLLVYEVMESLGYSKVFRVMVVMLPPHGEVEPHCDEGSYSNSVDRYHLVIGGDCTWNDSKMEAGWLYKVPHLDNHHIVAGDIGRTALIMDFSN